MHWVYAEAELLGIVAEGTLTAHGRELVAGDEDTGAAAALARAMPVVATTFTLQADLTATVVGMLDRDIVVELRLLADVESTGPATTFRFSEASLRRALDAGRGAEEILAFLQRHADKGVPQPLAYLVGDVARRHGHLRVGAAGSFVTSDDPGVLADACTNRRTRKLALRLLAPTVAVSPQSLDVVIAGLRGAGFLPTADEAATDTTPVRPSIGLAVATPAVPTSAALGSETSSADEELPERFKSHPRAHNATPSLDEDSAARSPRRSSPHHHGRGPSSRLATAGPVANPRLDICSTNRTMDGSETTTRSTNCCGPPSARECSPWRSATTPSRSSCCRPSSNPTGSSDSTSSTERRR